MHDRIKPSTARAQPHERQTSRTSITITKLRSDVVKLFSDPAKLGELVTQVGSRAAGACMQALAANPGLQHIYSCMP